MSVFGTLSIPTYYVKMTDACTQAHIHANICVHTQNQSLKMTKASALKWDQLRRMKDWRIQAS